MKPIITRFAPSPTGHLHVGNYRTALFSYLFARQHGGNFILRIEDTDKERSTKEFEQEIIDSLKWLGLEWDEFFRQSEALPLHTELLKELLVKGKAYMEDSVIRLKNPNKKVTFTDMIRGDITFDTTDLGDFVIAKALDHPLYHFAVVVDDYSEAVTHVIRGEDHISNTPRQILIHEALGWEHPEYAHLPLVMASDKTKLSKRKGAKSIMEYRDEGISPEAMLNAMAMIGWNPGTEQELFTKDELIKNFSFKRIKKGGAALGEEKLKWFNRKHI